MKLGQPVTGARIVEFTVQAERLPALFPVDMLRYDSAWPARQEDATAIAGLLDRRNRRIEPVKIRLKMLDYSGDGPTVGRWASYRWTVREVK
jgi:hypothetical protein